MAGGDRVHRFLFEGQPVRGHYVRLGPAWRAAMAHHEYPDALREVLGEALAAVTLLAGGMKFPGMLSLQLQGPGPVRLLLAQVTAGHAIRGVARHEAGTLPDSLAAMFGGGQLAVTLEREADGQRHQGITPLARARLAACLEDYFENSEQLPTRLLLAADGEHAAGLLLQRLGQAGTGAAAAAAGEPPDEAWRRIGLLAATLGARELLALPFKELLRRLFHEDDLRVFEPEPVHFRCRCSPERVLGILRSLGAAEAQALAAEQGQVEIRCEFCNRRYAYDAVDVAAAFSDAGTPPARGLH